MARNPRRNSAVPVQKYTETGPRFEYFFIGAPNQRRNIALLPRCEIKGQKQRGFETKEPMQEGGFEGAHLVVDPALEGSHRPHLALHLVLVPKAGAAIKDKHPPAQYSLYQELAFLSLISRGAERARRNQLAFRAAGTLCTGNGIDSAVAVLVLV
eukprot:1209675-Rhodomonas_salina.2